jgi:predicted nucleic acid-binding protein
VISGVVVVDASVAVEYLVELKYAAEATRFFTGVIQEHADLQLYAPDLIYPESVSALRKLVHLKAIPASAGAQAVDRLIRLPITTSSTAQLMPEAWQLRHAVTIYDACYLLLARRLDAPFLTADDRLARGRSRSGDSVLFLGDLV